MMNEAVNINGIRQQQNESRQISDSKKIFCGVPFYENVSCSVNKYLSNPDNSECKDLYQAVLSEVERPLFDRVMQYVRGNQTKAAELMGINRGTLRKKLKKYGLSI